MRLSNIDLEIIKDRASNLAERLSGSFFVPTAQMTADAGWPTLEQSKLPDADSLGRYAAELGRQASSEFFGRCPQSMVMSAKPTMSAVIPKWVSTLSEITAYVAETFAAATNRVGLAKVTGGSVPYEQLYRPVADYAWHQIAAIYPTTAPLLTRRARLGLQKQLVRRLAAIASTPIHPTFLAHKSVAGSGILQHFFGAGKDDSVHGNAKEYTKFVQGMGEDGLRSLFLNYPVAARLFSQTTDLWIEFVEEFLQRFQEDQHKLAFRFNDGIPLGKLHFIQTGISDSHHGGRSVLILGFHGGVRLVYKPRSTEIDQVFFNLIAEINARALTPKFRVLKILDCGKYGWMEYAAHDECPDSRSARRYYKRAGGLACLAYWLQGIDFHRENVIAAGEQPLLIDLESLAHPWRPNEIAPPESGTLNSLGDSVLRSGLLPLWQSRFKGAALYDNCGFNGPVKQQSIIPLTQWRHLNTDRMNWVNTKRYLYHSAHRPILAGRTLAIGQFEKEILVGYRAMAKLLTGSGAEAMNEWRERIMATTRRRIKRPTFVYALLLKRSLEPIMLKNGTSRSLSLLSLPCDPGDERDWIEEVFSMEKLDIPYFRVSAPDADTKRSAVFTPGRTEIFQQQWFVKSSLRYALALREGKILEVERARKGHRRDG